MQEVVMCDAGELCLCEICSCGDHKCPQVYDKELPKELQVFHKTSHKKDHSTDGDQENVSKLAPTQTDRYINSTYKSDFIPHKLSEQNSRTCDGGELEEESPPGKSSDILKCVEGGPMEERTTHKEDYVPWPERYAALFRGKSLIEAVEDGEEDYLSTLTPNDEYCLRKYYCPPHCDGNKKTEPKMNCLAAYKDHFNLGPPKKKVISPFKMPDEPVSTCTSYMLDYVPHKIEQRKELKPKPLCPTAQIPMSSDTTYMKEFKPLENVCRRRPAKNEDHKEGVSNVPFGDGETMAIQSSSMVDYKDPNVAQNMAVINKISQEYRPPCVKMESETTSRASYKLWKELPPQPMRHKPEKIQWYSRTDKDPGCFLTSYQVDFDGLRRALCPAKVIERYGQNALEPTFQFVGSKNDHDCYQYTETS